MGQGHILERLAKEQKVESGRTTDGEPDTSLYRYGTCDDTVGEIVLRDFSLGWVRHVWDRQRCVTREGSIRGFSVRSSLPTWSVFGLNPFCLILVLLSVCIDPLPLGSYLQSLLPLNFFMINFNIQFKSSRPTWLGSTSNSNFIWIFPFHSQSRIWD